MNERARFCQEWQVGGVSVAELCRAYGVSRVTGYKWLRRYGDGGIAALTDQSRARLTQPAAYPDKVRRMVIEARHKHPTWGAKKLGVWLARRHPKIELPSITTMETYLRNAGLIRSKRHTRKSAGPLGERAGDDRPNGVWSVDFKGHFRLGNGRYCYPLTIKDSYSRYLLRCTALDSPDFERTWNVFHQLFTERGLPDRIRSDNGAPFASCGHGRLSRLSVCWMMLGIGIERIRPGCPQDNGRHERMHRTLKEDTALPPTNTFAGQQRRFNRFRKKYNEERPHEALEMQCPHDFYEASSREYTEAVHEYPAHWERRTVSKLGLIRWRGRSIFLSEALIKREVGLVEISDGVWKISFRDVPIARLLDRKKARIQAIRPHARSKQRKPCG